MKLVHHPGYNLSLGPHVFPSEKFQMIRDRLVSEGTFSEQDILRPEPATTEQLLLAHDAAWIAALQNGTVTMQQIMLLEIPYSQPMVRAFQLMAGGTILAARVAIEEGAAMNIGGGFHHAHAGHGEGFCAIHDVAVAIRVMQHEGKIRKALVIDCDVHHGNGTAAIFADDPTVFTISLHQFNNYPFEKPPSNIDVHLPNEMEDDEYLVLLEANYATALEEFKPDLVMYVAGADPYFDDQLGGLALTLAGLRERDRMVAEAARSRGIPIVGTTAGGYARRLEDTVTIQATTAAVLRG
jgi:acetoin utilization deacetylase AcuC-like enzyme